MWADQMGYGPLYATGVFFEAGRVETNEGNTGQSAPIIGFDAAREVKTYNRRNEVAPNNYTMRLWVRVS